LAAGSADRQNATTAIRSASRLSIDSSIGTLRSDGPFACKRWRCDRALRDVRRRRKTPAGTSADRCAHYPAGSAPAVGEIAAISFSRTGGMHDRRVGRQLRRGRSGLSGDRDNQPVLREFAQRGVRQIQIAAIPRGRKFSTGHPPVPQTRRRNGPSKPCSDFRSSTKTLLAELSGRNAVCFFAMV